MKVNIDSDIRKAKTIPSKFYYSPKVYKKLKTLFNRSWQFIGDTDLLKKNNAHPGILLEGMVDEPYVLTKSDNRIRCFSNVCTHRGNIVCNDSCKTKTLVCGYHGRQFDINGKMKFMPEFDDVANFPSKNDNLPVIEMEAWKNLIFIINDKKCDLSELIGPLAERLSWLPIEKFQYRPDLSRKYNVKANWALYCDNYLEGFHIPFVHADLNSVLDYNDYTTELFEGGVLQIGIASEGEQYFDIPNNSPDFGKKIAAYYWWLFPGLMLNIYPWGVSVNIVVPESVDKTRVIYQGYVTDPDKLGQGAGGDLDKVEIEDQFVVEGCLRGVRSSAYDRGRYSPEMERGVHHFHRMLIRK